MKKSTSHSIALNSRGDAMNFAPVHFQVGGKLCCDVWFCLWTPSADRFYVALIFTFIYSRLVFTGTVCPDSRGLVDVSICSKGLIRSVAHSRLIPLGYLCLRRRPPLVSWLSVCDVGVNIPGLASLTHNTTQAHWKQPLGVSLHWLTRITRLRALHCHGRTIRTPVAPVGRGAVRRCGATARREPSVGGRLASWSAWWLQRRRRRRRRLP